MKRLIATTLLLAFSTAMAGSQNDIHSCYMEKLPAPKSTVDDVELFVVIDQTTLFDNGLKQSIANNIRPFIAAGNTVSLIQFSAFTQGHYTDVLVTAKLDQILSNTVRDDVSKPILAKFDQCLENQPRQAAQLIGAQLKLAFGGSSSDINKSDVIASLKDISGKVRQSSAKRKIVLLASDMLENSSISSFYSKQTVRQLDPEKELSHLAENKLFGDFGGAEVYVIGAGLLSEDAKQTKGIYRSPNIMIALSSFWKTWFQKSNANIVEFGQPALLNPVH